jgi:hypothetical protein
MTALMRKLSDIFTNYQGGIPCEINDIYVGNTANKTREMSTRGLPAMMEQAGLVLRVMASCLGHSGIPSFVRVELL